MNTLKTGQKSKKIEIITQYHQLAEKDVLKRLIQCIVREQLLPWRLDDCLLIINCPNSQVSIVAQNVHTYSMMRYLIQGDLFEVTHGKQNPLKIYRLLEILHMELTSIDQDQFSQFIDEIENNYLNTILSYKQMDKTNMLLAKSAKNNLVSTLYDFVEKTFIANKSLFFEQWASQGHPVHPCNKTKLGFNENEAMAFSPEFNPKVSIILCAINKDYVKVQMEFHNLSYKEWFKTNFSDIYQDWERRLKHCSFNPDNYLPIPIHPWQAEKKIKSLFKELFLQNKLLSVVHFPLHPTLSFRTLSNTKNPQIKLPVAVQATSALRTVSPASIQNSPQISRILREILPKEKFYDNKLRVLYDSVGIYIDTPNPDIAKNCSALFRDNINNCINEGEVAIVGAALFQHSPLTQSPLLIEMINALSSEFCHQQQHALNFFKTMVEVLLPPFLQLYLSYGIAMEAHQQNTIIVFTDKIPISSIIRDMGGVRIHLPTLISKGHKIDVFPDSATFTEDLNEARNKLIHALYQYQLGEMIILLSQHYNVAEEVLWKIVADKTYHCLDETWPEKKDSENWRTEEEGFFKPEWPIKSLMTMRLKGTFSKYLYSTMKNPLSAYRRC